MAKYEQTRNKIRKLLNNSKQNESTLDSKKSDINIIQPITLDTNHITDLYESSWENTEPTFPSGTTVGSFDIATYCHHLTQTRSNSFSFPVDFYVSSATTGTTYDMNYGVWFSAEYSVDLTANTQVIVAGSQSHVLTGTYSECIMGSKFFVKAIDQDTSDEYIITYYQEFNNYSDGDISVDWSSMTRNVYDDFTNKYGDLSGKDIQIKKMGMEYRHRITPVYTGFPVTVPQNTSSIDINITSIEVTGGGVIEFSYDLESDPLNIPEYFVPFINHSILCKMDDVYKLVVDSDDVEPKSGYIIMQVAEEQYIVRVHGNILIYDDNYTDEPYPQVKLLLNIIPPQDYKKVQNYRI